MRVPRLILDEHGAQIVEFAVVLPLLAVLIVGIFDFGQAFATRQKLTFAVRDAARFGSSEPTNDLTQPLPPSVSAIRDLTDADLVGAGLNDCGLGPIQAGTTELKWIATGSCSNSGTFTLTIDRGLAVPPASGSQMTLISTHVTISYPYQWHFNSVIRLLVPTATYAGITQLQTDAIVTNQD